MRSPWFNSSVPPLNWLLLCLVCLLMLIALLGPSSSYTFDSVTTAAKNDIYLNNRKVKQLMEDEISDLKAFSMEASRLKDFSLCGKDREIHVPCYNVSANLLAGFKDGEEFDRHCEVSGDQQDCLVRPPKDYKIPLNWPIGRDVIWSGNVKLSREQFLSSGSMTKRLMLLEENQIAFHSDDGTIVDGVKDYSHLVADMIGLESDSEFLQAGVRTVLDIGCGFGSFGSHLLSLNLMAICVAAYELTGSQVQIALERGLPAVIGNFIAKQLPFPSLSYDMVHCAQCAIVWDKKDGMLLMEVDRILRPGGYFVLTSPGSRLHESSTVLKKGGLATLIGQYVEKFAKGACWNLLAQQEETFIWQKTSDAQCYKTRNQAGVPICEGEDVQPYYHSLRPCISGTNSSRWVPIQNRTSSLLGSADLKFHGVSPEDFSQDFEFSKSILKNFWSLLNPLIFSDHPKRPTEEDPEPPYNLVRNVMDMHAHYGGLNSAMLEAEKAVWVMNVVSVGAPNTLPLIMDQGFVGVSHDWCEPFPTYPRTYDLLYGNGLLSHVTLKRCSVANLFTEMDRILRPEGWIVLVDNLGLVQKARKLAMLFHWESRMIDLQDGSDQGLLVCQKPFIKK